MTASEVDRRCGGSQLGRHGARSSLPRKEAREGKVSVCSLPMAPAGGRGGGQHHGNLLARGQKTRPAGGKGTEAKPRVPP